MKQMWQVRKPDTTLALDQAPTQPMATISEADLDKVSGGDDGDIKGDITVNPN
jgi:hypothetical protein